MEGSSQELSPSSPSRLIGRRQVLAGLLGTALTLLGRRLLVPSAEPPPSQEPPLAPPKTPETPVKNQVVDFKLAEVSNEITQAKGGHQTTLNLTHYPESDRETRDLLATLEKTRRVVVGLSTLVEESLQDHGLSPSSEKSPWSKSREIELDLQKDLVGKGGYARFIDDQSKVTIGLPRIPGSWFIANEMITALLRRGSSIDVEFLSTMLQDAVVVRTQSLFPDTGIDLKYVGYVLNAQQTLPIQGAELLTSKYGYLHYSPQSDPINSLPLFKEGLINCIAKETLAQGITPDQVIATLTDSADVLPTIMARQAPGLADLGILPENTQPPSKGRAIALSREKSGDAVLSVLDVQENGEIALPEVPFDVEVYQPESSTPRLTRHGKEVMFAGQHQLVPGDRLQITIGEEVTSYVLTSEIFEKYFSSNS